MAKKFIIKDASLEIYDTILTKNLYVLPLRKIWYKEEQLQNGAIELYLFDEFRINEKAIIPFNITDCTDSDDVIFTEESFRLFAEKNFSIGTIRMNVGESIDVNVQDQHSPTIIAKMSFVQAETTLSVAAAIDDTTITVTSSAGLGEGKYISIFDIISNRFYVGYAILVVGNVITLDTPLDFAYPSGSFFTSGISNMNVDGSVTKQIFGLRNTTETIGITMDITRIVFSCLTDGANDLSTFGDIADGLAKGIVLRKIDGAFRNIFNVKANGEIKGIMYDLDILSATNPSQGQNGFAGRLTFAGQSKIGVTVRLAPGEDLNLIIQDDLSSIQKLEITVEGHEVV